MRVLMNHYRCVKGSISWGIRMMEYAYLQSAILSFRRGCETTIVCTRSIWSQPNLRVCENKITP